MSDLQCWALAARWLARLTHCEATYGGTYDRCKTQLVLEEALSACQYLQRDEEC